MINPAPLLHELQQRTGHPRAHMGFEYHIRFSDPSWYAANIERITTRIRALSRLKAETSSHEFWLKDETVENSWPYDLRVFLRPGSMDIEVSSTTATFTEDIRDMLNWIRTETVVELVDDDGLPMSL